MWRAPQRPHFLAVEVGRFVLYIKGIFRGSILPHELPLCRHKRSRARIISGLKGEFTFVLKNIKLITPQGWVAFGSVNFKVRDLRLFLFKFIADTCAENRQV